MKEFYGKYCGAVIDNNDPMKLGRVMVTVPGVCERLWAMPCSPFAGMGVGFSVTPPTRANAWVEFERGNPGKPIVVGYYWGQTDISPVPTAEIKIGPDEIKLCCGNNTLTLSSTGIELASGPVSIKLDPSKMAAKCGEKVKLELANQGVNIAAGSATTASFGLAQVELSSGVVKVNDPALQVI